MISASHREALVINILDQRRIVKDMVTITKIKIKIMETVPKIPAKDRNTLESPAK